MIECFSFAFFSVVSNAYSPCLLRKSWKQCLIDIGRWGIYEFQWDNSLSKKQLIKVNHDRPRYGLQHGALAHTKQQAIKGPET